MDLKDLPDEKLFSAANAFSIFKRDGVEDVRRVYPDLADLVIKYEKLDTAEFSREIETILKERQ